MTRIHRKILSWLSRCSLNPNGKTPFRANVIIDLGLTFIVALGISTAAHAAVSSYYLDQSRLELTVNPKTGLASGSVKVTSSSATTTRIRILPKFWVLDEQSAIRYIDPPSTGFNILKNILINPLEFSLPPAQTKTVRFMVRVPESITDAEFPLQLVFEPTSTLEELNRTDGNKVVQSVLNVVPVFTTTVYVYKGNPQPNMQIREFTCGMDKATQKPIIKLNLENAGNKHARLFGTIFVNHQTADQKKALWDVVKLRNGNLIFVFPNVPRQLAEPAVLTKHPDTPWPSGSYQLDLELSDERNSQAVLKGSCALQVP